MNQWSHVDLREGSFSTALYRLVASTQVNARISISNNIQFDNVSRVLGWQSRFRWIVQPGNELYVVYQHNWLDDLLRPGGMETLSRSAATKMIYTHQF